MLKNNCILIETLENYSNNNNINIVFFSNFTTYIGGRRTNSNSRCSNLPISLHGCLWFCLWFGKLFFNISKYFLIDILFNSFKIISKSTKDIKEFRLISPT